MILALAALLAWPWSSALSELRALTRERQAITCEAGGDPTEGPARADRAARREGSGPVLGLIEADGQDESEPGTPVVSWARVLAPITLSDLVGPPPLALAAPRARARAPIPSVAHWFRC